VAHVGYLSMPILVFPCSCSRLRPDVRDRQTERGTRDVRQTSRQTYAHHRLMPPIP